MFLTAHGHVPAAVHAMHAMQAGTVDFVQKPFNAKAFLASVQRIVRRARERHAAHARCGLREQLAKLSARKREVLDGLLDDRTSKEIARALDLSPKTVGAHRAGVMRKLTVSCHLAQASSSLRGRRNAESRRPGPPDSVRKRPRIQQGATAVGTSRA